MRVVEELNQALHDLMAADDRLHLVGEDLLDPYGGAFKVTKGLSSRYPDRVMTSPISEAGLVGFSMGMAMRGKPVVAEIMFGDFLALTFDQLLNHAAKVNWMFDGKVDVPLVVRTPMGGGRGYGPTHSQSIEKHFCGVPGLTVLAVNQFCSPAALLKRAVAGRSPTLLIENKVMYAKLVEPARIEQVARPDAVVITYGGAAEAAVRAAERLAKEEEIAVNVTVVETLSPIDGAKVRAAAQKSPRVLVVEEGTETWGFGAECARIIAEAGLPLQRFQSLAAPSHPIPNSREWELEILPDERRIGEAILKLIGA